MSSTWTPDSVKALLDRSSQAVERAVLAIYRRQTQDEQASERTRHHNSVGFNAVHAHMGSYYARWVLGGHHLDGRHLERARRMMRRYARQLAEIAQSRQSSPAHEGVSHGS